MSHAHTNAAGARRILFVAASLAITFSAVGPVGAEKRYGPGVSDTEIKIGQTMP